MKKRVATLIFMVGIGNIIYADEVSSNNSADKNVSSATSASTNQEINTSTETKVKSEDKKEGVTAEQEKKTPKVTFSQEQLDQALAPVALYPDSLLAQLLMASTYPEQVMEAAKWSKEHPKMKGDKAVKAVSDKPWDSSVASLVAFPQVLEMMSNKPDWVKTLGDMFLNDPDAVMSTIQKLRHKAKEAGNLKSTKEQKVIIKEAPKSSSSSSSSSSSNTTIIEIEPATPETVYVPVYNPTVVYGSWWYPSHPPYYYHPPHITPVGAMIGFGVAVAAAHCLWSHWDWHRHDVHIDVHRHNNIHINRKIDINNNRYSWRQNIRERNTNIRRDRVNNIVNNRDALRDRANDRMRDRNNLRDRGRDVQREQLKNRLDRKGINLDEQRKNMLKNSDKIEKRVERANKQRDRMARPDRGNIKNAQRDRMAKPSRNDRATRPNRNDRVSRPAKKDRAARPVQRDRVSRPKQNIQRQPRSRPATVNRAPRVNRSVSRPAGGGGGRLRNR